MKKKLFFIGLSVLLLSSCAEQFSRPSVVRWLYREYFAKSRPAELSAFEQMMADSFALKISQTIELKEAPLDKTDTLWAKLYLAVHSLSRDDLSSADSVIQFAEQLMALDTITDNRVRYLEAEMLAYSMLDDFGKYRQTALRQYMEYPEGSLLRVQSLYMYYTAYEEPDSVRKYAEIIPGIVRSGLESDDEEEMMMAVMTQLVYDIVEERESHAKIFLDSCMASPRLSNEAQIELYMLRDNYSDFSDEIRKTAHTKFEDAKRRY